MAYKQKTGRRQPVRQLIKKVYGDMQTAADYYGHSLETFTRIVDSGPKHTYRTYLMRHMQDQIAERRDAAIPAHTPDDPYS